MNLKRMTILFIVCSMIFGAFVWCHIASERMAQYQFELGLDQAEGVQR